jgi:hypothetical protein
VTSDTRRPGAFVQQAYEQTREYMAKILEENERLRLELVKRSEELARRDESAESSSEHARENEYLRQMVTLLEDRIRGLEKTNLDQLSELARLQSRLGRLEEQLDHVIFENKEYLRQFRTIERVHGNLMNLYVTSYRLHGSPERAEVISAINETIINLVGSEDFGVYEREGESNLMRLVGYYGDEPPATAQVLSLDDPSVGPLLAAGSLYCSDGATPVVGPGGRSLRVLVPLRLGSKLAGAILVYGLLPQKNDTLEDVDLEVFDLLGSQAAAALFTSRVHAWAPVLTN